MFFASVSTLSTEMLFFCLCCIFYRLFLLRIEREADLTIIWTSKQQKASCPAQSLQCNSHTLRRPDWQPPLSLESRTLAPFMSPKDTGNCWKQVPQSTTPTTMFPHPLHSPCPPFPPLLLQALFHLRAGKSSLTSWKHAGNWWRRCVLSTKAASPGLSHVIMWNTSLWRTSTSCCTARCPRQAVPTGRGLWWCLQAWPPILRALNMTQSTMATISRSSTALTDRELCTVWKPTPKSCLFESLWREWCQLIGTSLKIQTTTTTRYLGNQSSPSTGQTLPGQPWRQAVGSHSRSLSNTYWMSIGPWEWTSTGSRRTSSATLVS